LIPAKSIVSPRIVSRVAQDGEALRRERRRHVPLVIVVAEDGNDTVRGGQRRECLGSGRHVAPIAPRHVVAAQDDQVRLFRHDDPHGRGDHLV
jgi:hypothetical protein